MGADLASHMVQHPRSVLHPKAVWVHLLSHIKNTRVKPTTTKTSFPTEELKCTLPFTGTVSTQSTPLHHLSCCPFLAVLLQGGLPWWHLCAHRGVYLGGIRGFIYGFVPYEEVQVINSPQYSPLSLVDHLRRLSDGDTWRKTTQSIHHHTHSFQPSRKDNIVPIDV